MMSPFRLRAGDVVAYDYNASGLDRVDYALVLENVPPNPTTWIIRDFRSFVMGRLQICWLTDDPPNIRVISYEEDDTLNFSLVSRVDGG